MCRTVGIPLDRRHPNELFYVGKPTEPSVPVPLLKETVPAYDREIKESVKRDSRREQHAAVALTKPKTVLLPGSPPEIAYAPPQLSRQQFYETRTSAPFTKAIGTETKKTVRMDESTESARRIVTVEQTSRVIKFGDTGLDAGTAPVQKRQAHYRVPTPKKFVQGQFRESDYESDVDSSRIRAKWAPADSDTEEPCYRSVRSPAVKSARSSSAPVRQYVASPMEFDTGPLTLMQTRVQEDRKIDFQRYQHTAPGKIDNVLQPGSPPEYGYISRNDVRKAADRKSETKYKCLVLLLRW